MAPVAIAWRARGPRRCHTDVQREPTIRINFVGRKRQDPRDPEVRGLRWPTGRSRYQRPPRSMTASVGTDIQSDTVSLALAAPAGEQRLRRWRQSQKTAAAGESMPPRVRAVLRTARRLRRSTSPQRSSLAFTRGLPNPPEHGQAGCAPRHGRARARNQLRLDLAGPRPFHPGVITRQLFTLGDFTGRDDARIRAKSIVGCLLRGSSCRRPVPRRPRANR